MSNILQFRLTSIGQSASWNAIHTGISVALTHVQLGSGNRIPDGSEQSLLAPHQTSAIAAGALVSGTQIRISALFTGLDSYSINEIGLWAGNPGESGSFLFAYWSQSSGSIGAKSPGVDFIFQHDMAVTDAVASGTVTILADNSQQAQALALVAAHEAKDDAHPQYQKSLGFKPVQQGTGSGQLGNLIKIGWSGSRLLATVDNVDQGAIVFDGQLTAAINAAVANLLGAPIGANVGGVNAGWCLLPGGLILQWGKVEYGNRNSTVNVLFPITFPVGVLSLQHSTVDGEGEVISLAVRVPSASGASFILRGVSGTTPDNGVLHYMVLGY